VQLASELLRWKDDLGRHWSGIHWGNRDVQTVDGRHVFAVQVYLGEIQPDAVAVELYAESEPGGECATWPLRRDQPLSGAAGGYHYVGEVPADRPPGYYTPRVVPAHAEALVPVEARYISWYP